jgi:23S rRNA (adenine2503-C2)-methyltransferase
MLSYTDLDCEQWKKWLREQGEKEFHAGQILDWIYQKGVLSWQEMSNLSKQLREKLMTQIDLPLLELVSVTESNDLETFKFLWRLKDRNYIESVLICSGSRRTVCVSSQVGCPVRCSFCASGQQGFIRNLRSAEIVEQVLQVNRWLANKGERVSHVVYMGMGEPLKNYEAVVKSIELLSHRDLCHISPRRITVSTVGIVEGIRRLSLEGLKVNLVLSLHAPNQQIRKKLIPYARKYPLEDILAAMDEYAQKTKRNITYEFILLAGINDHPDHALELAHLLKGKPCTVNLIPYNPVFGLKFRRPDKKAIKQFRSVLYGAKIVNTCRYTKGVDIAAACGQLALQKELEQSAKADEKASRLPLLTIHEGESDSPC